MIPGVPLMIKTCKINNRIHYLPQKNPYQNNNSKQVGELEEKILVHARTNKIID